MHGSNRNLTYSALKICGTCNGTRSKKGFSGSRCYTCGGSGSINIRDESENTSMLCDKCSGRGEVIKHPCTTCKGNGTEKIELNEEMFVPKGVDNNQVLRFFGKV